MAEAFNVWVRFAGFEKKSFLIPFPHIIHSKPAGGFMVDSFREFKTFVEKFTKTTITDDDLEKAIKTYNRTRRLLKRLWEFLKRENPPVTGADPRVLHGAHTIRCGRRGRERSPGCFVHGRDRAPRTGRGGHHRHLQRRHTSAAVERGWGRAGICGGCQGGVVPEPEFQERDRHRREYPQGDLLRPERDVLDVIQNDKCADGMGIFYTNMAKALGVNEEGLSELALQSKGSLSLAVQCSLSAETDAIDLLCQGREIADVANAVSRFVVERVADMCTTMDLKREVVVAGGLARSQALVRQLAGLLKQELSVLDRPEYAGAIGAVISNGGGE